MFQSFIQKQGSEKRLHQIGPDFLGQMQSLTDEKEESWGGGAKEGRKARRENRRSMIVPPHTSSTKQELGSSEPETYLIPPPQDEVRKGELLRDSSQKLVVDQRNSKRLPMDPNRPTSSTAALHPSGRYICRHRPLNGLRGEQGKFCTRGLR